MKAPIASALTFLALVLAVLLTGCSALTKGTHHPWQMRGEPVQHLTGKNGSDVPLGVVEFDDQGQLWRYDRNDPWRNGGDHGGTQMAGVLKELKARTTAPTDVIIFVHGWNNNARDEKDEHNNLQSFKDTLLAMSQHDPQRHLFGIYVSWRGKVLKGSSFVDYYNREASSIKIGRVEATSALHAISAVAHRNEANRVIAVGHSFGGVILLRAIAQPLAADLAAFAMDKTRFEGRGPEPFADTIVIVNPADNAVLASQLVVMMQDYKARYEREGKQVPLLVSLTSQGDWATGWVYHTASSTARYLLGGLMTSSAGATSSAAQEHATVTSVGFHLPIHSHRLEKSKASVPMPQPPADPIDRRKQLLLANRHPRDPATGSLVIWMDPAQKKNVVTSGPLEPFELQRICGATNDTPYWIFQVPPFVIADHTDVWNPNFVGLVSALYYAANEQRSPSTQAPSARALMQEKTQPPVKAYLQAQQPR